MNTATIDTSPIRILRRPEVEKRIGLGRSTIYLHMQQGTFPKPIRLGSGGAAAVGWLEHEIDAWLHEQVSKSRVSSTRA
ncbi:DNA-binding transcriptional activator AlpA [Pseudomonas marincola]|uniref:DNA-binding transcriptional activator AlpA n=1 Tax=Pseudomonas marincola TaxID=437900 RepID=A0A653DXT8_9PSED|nr:AlpA family transcriptional regulator [Pseudomonas marincola]CAE6931908.1 DNA-binding transcriptional activator AlpA [Pseudomonas marincola]